MGIRYLMVWLEPSSPVQYQYKYFCVKKIEITPIHKICRSSHVYIVYKGHGAARKRCSVIGGNQVVYRCCSTSTIHYKQNPSPFWKMQAQNPKIRKCWKSENPKSSDSSEKKRAKLIKYQNWYVCLVVTAFGYKMFIKFFEVVFTDWKFILSCLIFEFVS